MFSRKMLFSVVGALALCALLVFAKGKPPGSGGGGGTASGTVYFTVYQLNTNPPGEPGNGGRDLHQMDPDGSNKTSLGLGLNVVGEPSHALRGGQRWFLATRFTYTGTYPPPVPDQNGTGYSAIYAFSDDGSSDPVQLTEEPDMQPTGDVRWSPDDLQFSFVGRRWENGAVVESGLYVGDMAYDTGGGYPSLELLVAGSGIASHHWSPDGTQIVYAVGGQITIYDLATETTSDLTTGSGPVWSPDGSRIAFARVGSAGGIYTIRWEDGTGWTDETRILRSHAGKYLWYLSPEWSPTGDYLICHGAHDFTSGIDDVYRINADGGGKVNLTDDVDTDAIPVAWR